MEGQQQLISEERTGHKGIEAPDLLQKDITSNEVEITQQDVKLSEEKIIILNGEKTTQDGEATQDGEIHVKIELEDITHDEKKSDNEGGVSTADNNDKEVSSDGEMKPNECSAAKDEADTNEKQSSKHEELDTSDPEKTKSSTEMTVKEETTKETEETEEKERNGGHDKVVVDDGNNNAKRTRFSSEITIQPKVYFHAGNETVVTMSPGSTSDDVFKNESCQPSDSVLPQTFLPLTIFTCLFCPMIGLFAIYKSYSVKQFIKKGDLRQAKEASQHARQLGILTLAIGFFFVLAIITIAILVSTLT